MENLNFDALKAAFIAFLDKVADIFKTFIEGAVGEIAL